MSGIDLADLRAKAEASRDSVGLADYLRNEAALLAGSSPYAIILRLLDALAAAKAEGITQGRAEGLAAAASMADGYAGDSERSGCVAEAQVIEDLAGDIRAHTWPDSEVTRRSATHATPPVEGWTLHSSGSWWCNHCNATGDRLVSPGNVGDCLNCGGLGWRGEPGATHDNPARLTLGALRSRHPSWVWAAKQTGFGYTYHGERGDESVTLVAHSMLDGSEDNFRTDWRTGGGESYATWSMFHG